LTVTALRQSPEAINKARLEHAWEALPAEVQAAIATIAERAAGGMETMIGIGLGEALAEVDQVIALSQKKHPGKSWRRKSSADHLRHMKSHVAKFERGELRDDETGLHPLAHTIARGLMLLAILRGSK
jgi:hypothetical protein